MGGFGGIAVLEDDLLFSDIDISCRVPHILHEGHCPAHLAKSSPQSVQRNTVLVLVDISLFLINYSLIMLVTAFIM